MQEIEVRSRFVRALIMSAIVTVGVLIFVTVATISKQFFGDLAGSLITIALIVFTVFMIPFKLTIVRDDDDSGE